MAYLMIHGFTAGALTPPADADWRLIEADGLCAIVSATEKAYVRPSRRNMLKFQQSLEHVLLRGAGLLPMRFGIVADDEQAVRDVLQRYQADLSAWLARMRGKCEMGLRIVWDEARLFARVREFMPDAADNSTDVNTRIQVGQQVAEHIQAIHAATAERALAILQPLAAETRQDDPPDDKTSLNAAFLIELDAQSAFEAAVEQVDALFNGALLFKLVGPLPVYSFVDLSISLEAEQDA